MAVGAVQRSAGSDRRRVGGATKARQVTPARPPAAALGPETTSAAIEAVARVGTPAAYGRGHVFYRPAAAAETLFVLLEGRVALYRLSAAGRRLALATLHAGEVFGEASLVAQGTYGAYAVAAEPCRVRAVPRADAVRLLVDDPQHARWLLERIIRRLRVVEAQLAELAFKELPARLAGALLRLARRTATGHEVAGYSHRELAEMLGAHRESVTLILDLLQAEGTVAIARRRIRLRQPDRLRELAGAP